MNEELLSLLGATPEQIAQARQRSGFEELGLLGQALSAAGAPAPRGTSTLGRLGQAAGAYTQAPRQTMDTLLQDLLRKQQIQDMQKQRDQQARSEAARQQFAQQFAPMTSQTALAAPGAVGPTAARAGMIGQTPPLDRNRLLSAMLDPNMPPDVLERAKIAYEATKPVEPKGTFRPLSSNEVTQLTGYTPRPGEAFQMAPDGEIKAVVRPERGPLVKNIVGGEGQTRGRIKLDEKAAEDIYEWQSGGGQDMVAQIAQLKPVIEALEAGKPITGIGVAVQPDILLAMTNPEALQTRELVEEVVQRNLRAVLGAQFTEKEGDRLISRAFNPKLPPAENAKRVRRLFLQMSSAAEQKQAMADYFDEFGTLRGFKGKMPTIQDFYNAMEGGSQAASSPSGGSLQDAARRELDRRGGR